MMVRSYDAGHRRDQHTPTNARKHKLMTFATLSPVPQRLRPCLDANST